MPRAQIEAEHERMRDRATQAQGPADPPDDGDPCPSCGGGLDPTADIACDCDRDPGEEEFPSPWIWTDDGASPGPGKAGSDA